MAGSLPCPGWEHSGDDNGISEEMSVASPWIAEAVVCQSRAGSSGLGREPHFRSPVPLPDAILILHLPHFHGFQTLLYSRQF